MTPDERFARVAGTQHARADLKHRSIRGALATLVVGGVDLVLRIGSIAVLARLLEPSHFGLVGMALAVTAALDGIRDLGLASATMQRRSVTHRQVSNLFWINVAAGALLCAAFCLLAGSIASFFGDPRLAGITAVVSLTFVMGGVTVQHEALMGRQLRQGELALIRLLANAVSIAVAIWLALDGFTYWALVWREVMRAVCVAAGCWLRCAWVPGWPGKDPGTRELLRFGRELSLGQVIVTIVSNFDRILVGKLFGASVLGEYRQAHQLILVPIDYINQPANGVAYAGLSILQTEPRAYRNYYATLVLCIALSTMPVATFGTLYARELTLVVLGPDWIRAAPYMAIFAAAVFMKPLLGSLGLVLLSHGETRRLLVLNAVTNLAFLGLVGVGSFWDARGIAMAHVITPILMFVPYLRLVLPRSPVTVESLRRAVQPPLLASAVMAVGLVLLRFVLPQESVVRALVLGGMIGSALFALSILAQSQGRAQILPVMNSISLALKGWRRRTGQPLER